MKKILSIICCGLMLSACSFKGNKESTGGGATTETTNTSSTTVPDVKVDPTLDSDGDGVTDLVEVENGSDPLIADVPTLDSNFFQNFIIKVDYILLNGNIPQNLAISTKIKDTDSSFKYRVGKLFGVDNSLYYAAKEGRFSGHSYGQIKNEDFSWVKYPALDPLMLHSDILKYRPIIDGSDPITGFKYGNFSVNISLESNVKLTGVRFKEIKDLSVNFYYHDYEKDSYVLLKNVILKQTFQRNINENFAVEIENVPVEFLRNSYLKHGEFLISEIDNYFIPELNKDYKTLMASVKAKTVPVLLTTPSEDSIYYVATSDSGISFLEVLNRVFAKNYEVVNNVLKRIGQYENNLGTFEHLIDVKDKDKLGEWFVLTNKFKDHFLDHQYQSADHITLSYVTGKNLATQPASVQSSFVPKYSTETYNESVTPLGIVSPNSKIEIQLKGVNRFGHEVVSTPFSGTYHYGGAGNSTALDYSCSWAGNQQVEFSRNLNLTINYNEEWDKMFLVINEERFKLSTLIAEKKVIVRNLNFSYLISIDDISKIKSLKQSDENNVSLVILSSIEKNFRGIKLLAQGGNHNSGWCTGGMPGALSTYSLSHQYGYEISKGSIDAAGIQKFINDCHTWPNNTGAAEALKIKMMEDADYEQNFAVAISSRIINYFN
ncbi:MAG: thrombospondin type 3 repeat-containing protein [Bacteriovorax sp.]|nr:thrombospondin type 3 repeat-containing protein [Bacteriovorax sp.]